MPRLTEAQLAARQDGMGSTEVVEVNGLAPWQDAGPWRVYNAKLGIMPRSEPTHEQEWGHRQERLIAEWYAQHFGDMMVPSESHHSISIPWLFASLDGITPDRTVEIKNVSGFMARDWDESDPDGVPHYVRAQVQIGMFCAGREECHVVAGIAGRPPQVWTVQYDSDLCAMMVETARKFWLMVQQARAINADAANWADDRGLPPPSMTPPPDASESCRDYLRSRYPKDEREMLVPDIDAAIRLDGLAAERRDSSIERNRLDAKVRELDAVLMGIVGAHKGVEGDWWKFTWKADKNGQRRSRFTVRGDRE